MVLQHGKLNLFKYFHCSFTGRLCSDVYVELKLGRLAKVENVLGVTDGFEDGKVSKFGVLVASVARGGSLGIFFLAAVEDDRDKRRGSVLSCVKVFPYGGCSTRTRGLLFCEYPCDVSSALALDKGRKDSLALFNRYVSVKEVNREK